MIRPKLYFATRIFDKSTHQQDYDNDKDEPMATREVIFVPPGKEIESLSSDIWDEIDGAQPSRWWILKEVGYDMHENGILIRGQRILRP
jgi:hypothetical protein